MLAVNVAVLVGDFLYKSRCFLRPLFHLLVDYHFGFTKRGLIAPRVAVHDKVAVWMVFALGGAIWLVHGWLFVQLFRRTFGFDREHLPLFVLMRDRRSFSRILMYAGSLRYLRLARLRSRLLLGAGAFRSLS